MTAAVNSAVTNPLDFWLAELRKSREENREQALPFLEWSLRVPEAKTGTLDFNRFPYQVELYNVFGSEVREVVARKATQVGISALLVRWALYEPDRNNHTILYIFPTADDVYDFADARIQPMFEKSEYLSARAGSPFNKGMKRVGSGLCLGGESLVLTRRGYLPIRTVRVGDEVLTHRGRWRRVAQVRSRMAEETITLRAHGCPKLVVTPEHPVLARRREGRRVLGGELIPPVNPGRGTCLVGGCERPSVARGLCGAHHRRARMGSPLGPAIAERRRRNGKRPGRETVRSAPAWTEASALATAHYVAQTLPPIEEDNDGDEDFWWFVGRYLADGWVVYDGDEPRSVAVACHSLKESELASRLPHAVTARKRGNQCELRLRGSGGLARYLSRYGRYAHGKFLTAHALALPERKARALLAGYLSGDGCVFPGGNSAVSVSRPLALGMALLAQRVYGVAASVHRKPAGEATFPGRERPSVTREAFNVVVPARNHAGFVDDGFGWRLVRAVERSGCARVWNLEVEDDESFIAENVIVHNCYFRGSESRRKLDSVDADGIAFDEYDTLNQAHIPDAERRLSGILSAGLIRRVGVPSLPQFGIAEAYSESDQRKWLVQCSCDLAGIEDHETKKPLLVPRGKGWQAIDFWHNVDQERDTPLIVCEGCNEPLDVAKGRWVKQNPDSPIPGFHISRLIVPGIERVPVGGRSALQKIIAASLKTEPANVEVFYNKDLGLPYLSKEAGLDEETIKAAVREFAMAPGYVREDEWPVTMGVDVASERALRVRISRHLNEYQKQALLITEVEDDDEGRAFDQLALLMRRYDVAMCAIDAMPETRYAREFQVRFPGRVYLIRLPDKQKQVLVPHEDLGEYSVRRTDAFDAMVEQVRRQNNLLPIQLPAGYVSEMTAPRRRVEQDEVGNRRAFWVSQRVDDYALAEVYDLIATEIFWVRAAVAEASEEWERPLDEMTEIHRSPVADYGSDEYNPGPDSGY